MAAQPLSGIYEIVNLVNGKRYVGSAVDAPHRFREHRWRLAAGTHHSRHLQSAWIKHGEAAFDFRVIHECAPHLLIAEEQAEFDRKRPEYNVCPIAGSTLGKRHTAEAKAKIGDRLRGSKRNPSVVEATAAQLRGRKLTPERTAHLAGNAHAKGAKHSEGWKAANAERLQKQYEDGVRSRERPPEYREKIAASLRGRTLSAEHRAKVSAAMKGKKRGPYKLDPAKADAKRESGRRLAAEVNSRRWGFKAN